MALVLKDRVQETSTTTGTGTFTLAGAVTQFQTFSAAIGNGNTTYYTAYTAGGTDWEVGIGTVGAGTLTRDTILASSNSGNVVTFGAGTKYIFGDYPADTALYASNNGTQVVGQVLKSNGPGTAPSWQAANNGTVTSVGISTTAASLAVTNSPITSSGNIGVNFSGIASQYVRGDGSLANFPTTGGGGSSVSYYLNGSVNQGTFVGNTYYEMNKTPIIGTAANFTIAADGYIAQFITDANDPSLLAIPGGNWNFEMYFSASAAGGSPSFYVELYKYNGTAFTLIASSSTNPEVITGGTSTDLYTTALAVPQTTLAVTDRLAIRIYVTHSGRTITLHTQDNTLCQIITTFSTGINALNGLTAQVQYFATGTSGSDFNISSATDTHTFNIPSASATNRGLLTSADWTTFNGKVTSVSGTSPIVSSGGTTPAISIPQANGSTNGFLSSTDWTTFNNKGSGTVTSVAALTLGTTGTDLSSTVANGSTTPVITLNVPTASATNRGVLSSADWTTFNNKGNGTVTSVGGTGTVNGITLTGTVTSSGSLTLGGTLSNVSLATQVTGTLPVANGGTGLTTLTANNVILGNGTSAPTFVAPGTNGNVLTSNGTTWVSQAAGGGGGSQGFVLQFNGSNTSPNNASDGFGII